MPRLNQGRSQTGMRALAIGALVLGPLSAAAMAEDREVPGAYATIQLAIDAALPDDVVIVADGTYVGPGNRDLDFGGKRITVRSANGADDCTIDCEEMGRAFYFHSGEDDKSVVMGFTIINGLTNDRGGAILCEGSGPTIMGCDFEDNAAVSDGFGTGNGGAIYCAGASPLLDRCNFRRNRAVTSVPDPEDPPFFDNSGLGGAVMAINGSDVTLLDCTFEENEAVSPGLGGNGIGGAIFIAQSNSDPDASVLPSHVIVDCGHFSLNTAAIAGGAIWLQGVESAPEPGFEGSSLTVTRSAFAQNSAQSGGAIAGFSFADLTVDDCAFHDNFTVADIPFFLPGVQEGIGGGAIGVVLFSTPAITNSVFEGNESRAGLGGAVSSSFGNTTSISDCEFRGNHSALSGGAVAVHALPALFGGAPSSLTMTGSMLEHNSADLTGGAALCTEGSSLTITACDFTENSVSGIGPSVANGGAIVVREGGSVSATGCAFTGNTASGAEALPGAASGTGGAIAVGEANLDLSTCTFTGNQAIGLPSGPPPDPPPAQWPVTGFGGAVILSGGATSTMTDCTFTDNDAVGDPGYIFDTGIGGALFVIQSDPVLDGCVFEGNSAYIAGGAAYLQETTASLSGCSFTGNTAQSGGALALFLFGSPTIDDCQFTGNEALSVTFLQPEIGGGAIGAVLFSNPVVTGSTFVGNTSTGVAGAVSTLGGSNASYTHCEFRGNHAALDGGAISTDLVVDFIPGGLDAPGTTTLDNCLVAGNSAGGMGGGVFNGSGSTLTMVSCTVAHNATHTDGGGLANMGAGSTADVDNCIFWGNDAEWGPGGSQILDGPGGVTVDHSLVKRGWKGAGANNIERSPRFVDADEHGCPDGNDYRLSKKSPAIDAGDDAVVSVLVDLNGEQRIVGPAVDMGAYEYQGMPVDDDG